MTLATAAPPAYLEVLPEAIPAELRAMPWVLWRAEPRPGESKPAKVPYRVSDADARASSTDAASWGSFPDAVEAYSALVGAPHSRGPVVGVGVVLTLTADVVCLDLDQVLEGDALDPRAARVVAHCASWTERSPSRTGLHIFGRGRLPRALKGAQFEAYGEARYIAVTGHAWGPPGRELRDLQGFLDRLAARESSARPAAYTGPTVPPPDDLTGALIGKVQSWGLEVVGSLKRWEDGYLLELRRCPWAESHTTGAGGAAVLIRASGAFDFTCLHAHCAARTWRDFRARMEPAR